MERNVACTGEKMNAYITEEKRPLGKPRSSRWEDNIKMDLI
jgi:hypothetical protein